MREQGLTRRDALKAGALGAAGLGVAGCGSDDSADAEEPRNVLFILSDSTRTDYIGAYGGGDKADTPNIDALARDGLRFTRAVPEAMPTVPVRRALLTGTRSFPFRDWQATRALPPQPGWSPIPEHRPLIFDALKRAEVTSAYVTDNPFLIGPRFAAVRRTLDHSRSVFLQGQYRDFNKAIPRSQWASPEDVEPFVAPKVSRADKVRLQQDFGIRKRGDGERAQSAARVFGEGIKLLDSLRKEQSFFLGIDAFDPHEVFDPPRAYRRRLGKWDGDFEPMLTFDTPFSRLEDIDLSDAELARMRDLYAAELTHVDAWIGRLLDKLDSAGLAENTLVIYTSDHGLTLGERGILGKYAAMIHKEIYALPLIIRDPKGRRRGKTTDYFASTHDIAPTALSYLGVPTPGRMEGEDLTLLLEDEDPSERPYWTTAYGAIVGAGDGRWLLLSDNQGKQRRLYDTREDPGETKNVAADNPEVVDRLWQNILDDAGGTMPVFGDRGVERG